MGVVDLVLCAVGLPLLMACGYLAMLALLACKPSPVVYEGPFTTRFDVIVPAHDEEAGIAATVENLRGLSYPADQFRVIVIADNCTDATAQKARDAGATVWERAAAERGKGFALKFAYQRSAQEQFANAIVVIDADSRAATNLLSAFDARLQAGARAVQAEYGVLNVSSSWRTQLMALAFALFHGVRSTARERLSFSAGLRGNGMCFTHELLAEHPHRAFSVVEDVEYGAQLSEAGVVVQFAADTHVLGEMPSGEKASRSQRRRWEGGRQQLIRDHVGPLLRRFISKRDGAALDTAVDLLIPPLSKLCGFTALLLMLTTLLSFFSGEASVSLYFAVASAMALNLYVVRGWQFSGLGLQGLSALARAPGYLFWKIVLRFKRPEHARGEWVRTAREPSAGGPA